MNSVFIVVMGTQKSLDKVEVPGGLSNREKGREFFLNWNRKFWSNQSEGSTKKMKWLAHIAEKFEPL